MLVAARSWAMVRSRLLRAHAVTALLVPLFAALVATSGKPPAESPEVRALWVVRTSLTSEAAVEEMVKQAQAGRFNTLLVQVRGRGDAYYNDAIEPRAAALSKLKSFDPLAAVHKLAHERHLRVHAWINVNLVSSASELPSSRAHLVYRHPEWLMVPRALARDMVLLNARSQLYLDKLTRWTRSQSGGVEGLYLSPIPEDAAEATVSVVADIVSRYPVDGIHLDYLRYPDDQFDYSRQALLAFRDVVADTLPPAEKKRREQAIGGNLVGWTDAFPEQWLEFRRDRLTALVGRIRKAVNSRRPGTLFSVAVAPDPAEALSRRMQDWRQWLRGDLIDVVCPMAYATDSATFEAQVTTARQGAGPLPVWAGIGAYRLSTSQTIENIQTARRLGATGIILFSYDSLSSESGSDYLSQVGRVAFSK